MLFLGSSQCGGECSNVPETQNRPRQIREGGSVPKIIHTEIYRMIWYNFIHIYFRQE